MKKYKFGYEENSRGLKQIIAVKDFDEVKAGDIGGWIESEANLSHDGNCWVYNDAQVYDNACVSGNAKVHDSATISGNAKVSDNAWLFGNAQVFGDAKIYDNACVRNDAHVSGKACVFGMAQVFGKAQVFGRAKVFDNTEVFEAALVSGNAKVSDNAWVYGGAHVFGNAVCTKNPIHISGLEHLVTLTDNYVMVDGEAHSYEEWRGFSTDTLNKMDGNMAEFYPTLMAILDGFV